MFINKFLSFFNLRLSKNNRIQKLLADEFERVDLQQIISLLNLNSNFTFLEHLQSQKGLRQDLFVLVTLNFKHAGYFVEFGAGDGKTE